MKQIDVLHEGAQKESYSIIFESNFDYLNKFISDKKHSSYFVLVDENTRKYCLPKFAKYFSQEFHLIEIPSGEKNKSLDTCQIIWEAMLNGGADRKSLLLNLGGGVIGDMGGFCAATFKRGFDFIQIPTTLLAQVDASIGGKLAIDFKNYKNNIGLFKNPRAVILDTDFLNTLSGEELRSGYAEILKHELISKNNQWQELRNITKVTRKSIASFIIDSVSVKNEVVAADPFENGLRKVLNFGHTIGHAVETLHLNTDKHLLHGEAIAIGMICECYLSNKLTGLPSDQLDEIVQYIIQVYGMEPGLMEFPDKLLTIMRQDKKNKANKINFTLLKSMGAPIIDQETSDAIICESLEYYNSLIKS